MRFYILLDIALGYVSGVKMKILYNVFKDNNHSVAFSDYI